MGLFKNNTFRIIAALALTLPLVTIYNSCDFSNAKGGNQSLDSQNYFQSQPPGSFCGSPGFNFLMDEYFGPHCSSCHNSGTFSILLIDPDNLRASQTSVSTFGDEAIIHTIIDNKFCGDNCNLSPGGEMYQAIEEWLSCPN